MSGRKTYEELEEYVSGLQCEITSLCHAFKCAEERNVQYEGLIKELKMKLDISCKFETIHRIDSYFDSMRGILEFTALIDQITEDTDLAKLVDIKNKERVATAVELMDMAENVTTSVQLQSYREQLAEEFPCEFSQPMDKGYLLKLKLRFNDDTLHNYFEISKSDNGYAIDSYIGVNDVEILIPECYLGENITKLGESLFSGCKHLKTLIVQAQVTTIPNSFCVNSGVTVVALPDSVKRIEQFAFASTALSSIEWSSTLEEIGTWAFLRTKIEAVVFPKTLKCIKEKAFYGCTQLKNITFNEYLQVIEQNAFKNVAITNLTIPRSITSIGSDKNTPFDPDTILECYPDSYAQRWARGKGFTIQIATNV